MTSQEWNRIDPLDPETPDLGSWIGAADEDEPNAEDAADSPRERPLGVEEYGVTAWEQAHHEAMASRLGREIADRLRRRYEPESGTNGAPAGRLVLGSDGEAEVAVGDTGGSSCEEAAVHIEASGQPSRRTERERLETVEHEIAALVQAAHVLADAVDVLAKGLQPPPAEEPGEAQQRMSQAGRDVRELLLSARNR
ncbi:MAG TPA: hypothetical protein VME70_09110 [Mycobacteriales bacterium]|nr:hypothetical protein [Mycobacteriales bacterium]